MDELDMIVDSCSKFQFLNYVQDNLINERYGSDVNAFYNSFTNIFILLLFFGIQWILNGQEGPQFERISIFQATHFPDSINLIMTSF